VLGQVGTMTHFARADDDPAVTRDQIDCFLRVNDGLSAPVSLCNSAATLTPGLAAGIAGDPQWARPGICLYGASPFADRPADTFGPRPALTLSARLRRVPPGPAGRVSMDMLAVDLDPVPGAAVGAPVVLWGQGGPSVDEVATACGTIGYELLTAVTPRVPRRVL